MSSSSPCCSSNKFPLVHLRAERPLHQHPHLSYTLELVLGFLKLLSSSNNDSSQDNSSLYQRAISFWKKLGMTLSSNANQDVSFTTSSSSSVETIFVTLKVIETLIENFESHHYVEERQDHHSSSMIGSTVITQRDIYYSFVDLLPRRDQSIVNKAIERVCSYCKNCPRYRLGIYTSTRGFVAGCLILGDDDDDSSSCCCSSSSSLAGSTSQAVQVNLAILGGNQGMAIPGEFAALPAFPENAENDDDERNDRQNHQHRLPIAIRSNARCILLVEKDSVFQQLVGARLWTRYPMIIITGRGFPDVATKVFLSRLASWLKIPVYGLVDYNPAGLRILYVYRFGSKKEQRQRQLPQEATASMLCPSLRWLGARSQDLELVVAHHGDNSNNNDNFVASSSSPSCGFIPTSKFTKRDSALAQSLKRDLSEQKQQKNPSDSLLSSKTISNAESCSCQEWELEVDAMISKSTRFDLEAIPDLCSFVLQKVVRGDAI